MSERKKFIGFMTICAIIAVAITFLLNTQSISGITLLVLFVIAVIAAYLTVALFVSVLTKKPSKTLKRFFNIFDVFVAWP